MEWYYVEVSSQPLALAVLPQWKESLVLLE
jgi:hypothetical protein